MTAYTLTLFVFGVLLATNRSTWRWLGERWADVRDAMREENEE